MRGISIEEHFDLPGLFVEFYFQTLLRYIGQCVMLAKSRGPVSSRCSEVDWHFGSAERTRLPMVWTKRDL